MPLSLAGSIPYKSPVFNDTGQLWIYTGSLLIADGDETVHTATNALNYTALAGISYIETATGTLLFKSAAANILSLEMGANDGFQHRVGDPLLTTLSAGDALIANASFDISSVLIYVFEFNRARE